jgi:hypothetical protein
MASGWPCMAALVSHSTALWRDRRSQGHAQPGTASGGTHFASSCAAPAPSWWHAPMLFSARGWPSAAACTCARRSVLDGGRAAARASTHPTEPHHGLRGALRNTRALKVADAQAGLRLGATRECSVSCELEKRTNLHDSRGSRRASTRGRCARRAHRTPAECLALLRIPRHAGVSTAEVQREEVLPEGVPQGRAQPKQACSLLLVDGVAPACRACISLGPLSCCPAAPCTVVQQNAQQAARGRVITATRRAQRTRL